MVALTMSKPENIFIGRDIAKTLTHQLDKPQSLQTLSEVYSIFLFILCDFCYFISFKISSFFFFSFFF
jgi:hypothetical protein